MVGTVVLVLGVRLWARATIMESSRDCVDAGADGCVVTVRVGVADDAGARDGGGRATITAAAIGAAVALARLLLVVSLGGDFDGRA